jgi:hypothetical protein
MLMENKRFYSKIIVTRIFILVGVIVTYVGFNEVLAQISGNQSPASGNQAGPLVPYSPGPSSNPHLYPSFNQSKIFPNSTETAKSFDKLNGNNTQFFTKDKSVSYPGNNLGNSLAINKFQSH